MKIVSALGVVGGLLGAVVALVAHFMSRTVPSTFYVGTAQIGRRVDATLDMPLVHPSWWPSLPVAVGIGVLIGLLLGSASLGTGVRLTRITRIGEPT
jgi:hypothetical protein